jgi:hypothetical protein
VLADLGRPPVVSAPDRRALERIYAHATIYADAEAPAAALYMVWIKAFLSDPYAVSASPTSMLSSLHLYTSLRPFSADQWTETEILNAYEKIRPDDEAGSESRER